MALEKGIRRSDARETESLAGKDLLLLMVRQQLQQLHVASGKAKAAR